MAPQAFYLDCAQHDSTSTRQLRAIMTARLCASPLPTLSGCTWPHATNGTSFKTVYLTTVALLLITANAWMLLQLGRSQCGTSSRYHAADAAFTTPAPVPPASPWAASEQTPPWLDANCQWERTQYVPSPMEAEWFKNARSWEPEYCRHVIAAQYVNGSCVYL